LKNAPNVFVAIVMHALYHATYVQGGANIAHILEIPDLDFFYYRQHCTQRKPAGILIYSEADFEVFRPAGATRCTDRG